MWSKNLLLEDSLGDTERRRAPQKVVLFFFIFALRPRGLTTYSVSKAAVIGLTQAMAVDHGKDHIRINCICPGPMYTPMVYARGNTMMSDSARSQRAKASVLKVEGLGWDRPADPQDPTNHAKNRRVEVKVYPAEKA